MTTALLDSRTRGSKLALYTRLASIVIVTIPCVAFAQTPPPSVSLSFGIDTTVAPVGDIVRLTKAYLARPDSSARSRGLWSSKSDFDTHYGDLGGEAYQGFPATILGVTGTGPGDSVFVVKILHATADSSRTQIQPLALQRLYAVRAPAAPYGWQLSSPLPRLTGNWVHRAAGVITFWYAPGQRQSVRKRQEASQFVDSVARLFGVARPEHINAYLTGRWEQGQRLLGLDFFPEGSGAGSGLGGLSVGTGILLLSNPAIGEAYLHELVHLVLWPVQSHNHVFGEGVAVWLGGSQGRSPKAMYEFLHRYQLAHPNVKLTDIIGSDTLQGVDASTVLYATRGLIVDSIYRQSGIPGLRRFALVSGTDDQLIAALPSYISEIGTDINQWWRTQATLLSR